MDKAQNCKNSKSIKLKMDITLDGLSLNSCNYNWIKF